MRVSLAIAALGLGLLPAALAAGGPASAPQGCVSEEIAASDRTVDEYIAEINKQKGGRRGGLLPDNVCIFGWCTSGRTPGPVPESPEPPAASPPEADAQQDADAGCSSSRETSQAASRPCLTPYNPLRAAEHAEVGDFYFARKNYRAALSRYREALEHKPADPTIHLRLGRTWELMDEPDQAFLHYEASVNAPQEGPWMEEASSAVERLRPGVEARRKPARP